MMQNSSYYPTQSEYEALPPILKRKCFSTLERLRYAEAQAQAGSQISSETVQSNQGSLPKKFVFNRSVNRLRHGLKFSARNQQIKAISQPEPVSAPPNVTFEDAIWFSQLPDKVKRGYFSLEEEKQFNAKRTEFTRPATTESTYKFDQAFNQSLPSLQDPSSCLSSTDESTVYSLLTEDEADEDDKMEIVTPSTQDWHQWDMDRALNDCRQIINNSKTFSTDTALPLDLYYTKSSDMAVEPISDYDEMRQVDEEDSQSVRSLKTLHRQRLDEWRSQWTPQNLPPIPPIPETATVQVCRPRKASVVSVVTTGRSKTAKSLSDKKMPTQETPKAMPVLEKTTSMVRPPIPAHLPTPPDSPLPIAEPKAIHYTDPETRLKLRMYLASSSKFDEAVEFGFPSLPSLEASEAPSLSLNTTATNQYHRVKELKQSRPTASIFTSYTDGVSVTEVPLSSSPTCSIQSDFSLTPYLNSRSSVTQERKIEVQAQLRQMDRDPYVGTAGREMTLRMTLTRPDLRADGPILQPATYIAPGSKPSAAFASSDGFMRSQDLNLEEEARLSLESKSSAIRRLWTRK